MEASFNSQDQISLSVFKKTRMIINNVSHEIRTPLNAIMGFADNLYETEKDEQKKRSLLAIKTNSDRLFAIARKLIDFSSIETGQFPLVRDYIHIQTLLLDLENKYRNQIEQKSLELKIINRIPANHSLFCDYNVSFEILEMLLENAIKFTQKGTITLETSYEKNQIIYSLSDTGCGIAHELKDSIFHSYRQGNSEMDREYEGLGLGLTIAEKLTHLAGGSIVLDDDYKMGARFIVTIKADSIIDEHQVSFNSQEIIPEKIPLEFRNVYINAVKGLSENIKVFNPGQIRKISGELSRTSDLFSVLSRTLMKMADTYNETDFSILVGELLKGIKDED
jgi:signal transduction histidine kinase